MAFELLAAGKPNGNFSALTADSGETFSGDVTGLYIENGEIRGNAAGGGEKIQVVGYTTSSDTNQAYELTYRKDSNLASQMWWLFGGADLTDCYAVRTRIEADGTSTFNLWRFASGGNVLLDSSVSNATSTGFDYVVRINHTATGIEVNRGGSQVLSSNDTTYSPNGKVIGFRVDDTWAANTGLQVQRLWQEVVDTEAPVITVPGPNPLNLAIGDTYTEPTGTYVDNVDGSGNVTNVGGDTVDVNTVGTYNVTYDYTDNQGNAATQVVLVVEVFEPVNIPKTYVSGVYPVTITATALNGTTQVINSTMTVAGWSVDSITGGTIRTGDTVTIQLTGASATGKTLNIAGAAVTPTAQDANSISFAAIDLFTFDGGIYRFNENITIQVVDGANSGTIDFQVTPAVGYEQVQIVTASTDPIFGGIAAGDYIHVNTVADSDPANMVWPEGTALTLRVMDMSDATPVWGNEGTVTLVPPDTEAPVIVLTGSATVNIDVGGTYTEQGATWTDNVDGSGNAVVGGDTVDINTAGTYTVTYDYTDAAGNAATQVTRTVNVNIVAPVMPANTTVNVDENTTAVGTFTATSGTTPITYSVAGTDAASFTINSTTGVLAFIAAPNYEVKSSYSVNVVADNGLTDSQTITVNINNVLEDLPTIQTGGAPSTTIAQGSSYSDPAWTWFDDVVSDQPLVAGNWSGDIVNTSLPGTYTRTASVTNGIGTTDQDYTITVTSADVTPDAFSLGADVADAEPSATYQRQFTIAGIDAGHSVAVTATGSASVNPTVGRVGDTITVTLIAGTFGATVTGGVTINGVSDSFSVTTRAQILPTITTQPTNQTVIEGQTATFFATFNNAASIQWYDGSGNALAGEVNSTLTVNTVLADDGNTYYAAGTSVDAATVQTNTVTLTVTESTATVAPTINTGGNLTTTIQVGDTYTDPAWTASDDAGPVDIDWSGTVDTATAGTYTRTATAGNNIGSDSAVYTVTVEEVPAVVEGITVETPSSRTIYTSNRDSEKPVFIKDTSDVVDYLMDFSVSLQGDPISTVISTSEYVTIDQTLHNEQQVQVWLSGGGATRLADVDIKITSEAGRTIERGFRLKVGEY